MHTWGVHVHKISSAHGIFNIQKIEGDRAIETDISGPGRYTDGKTGSRNDSTIYNNYKEGTYRNEVFVFRWPA